MAGGDIKKDKLIAALLVVKSSQLGGVTGVSELQEANAFHNASGVHI